MLLMDNSWDTQMEKFEKLHGHHEIVLLRMQVKNIFLGGGSCIDMMYI
jgi:hypothetical protein